MKTIKSLFAISIVSILALTSCKKDKEDPTITITTPAEHSEHALGSMIHVEGTFEDDRDLKSYTMMVGDVNGEHIHGFHHDESSDISGKSYHYHSMVTMPDSLSVMMFYLHFTVTDAKGKTASVKHMLHKQ